MKFFSYLMIIITLLFTACTQTPNKNNTGSNIIHHAHLTNSWYPQNAQTLKKQINEFLRTAKKHFSISSKIGHKIKAIISPHAGIFFSGICAAAAYAPLLESGKNKNQSIKKVIILSPSHTKHIEGLALPHYDIYETVLGQIPVNKNDINSLLKLEFAAYDEEAHNKEHAIEIELPFLQETIASFEFVPIIVGNITSKQIQETKIALRNILKDDTLLVISTDFMHFGSNFSYKPFQQNIFYNIRNYDSSAIEAILNKDYNQFCKTLQKTQNTICGQNPIKILLSILEENRPQELHGYLTCYYNSAQLLRFKKNQPENIINLLRSIPDEDCNSCVSYAAIIFSEKNPKALPEAEKLTQYEKNSLLVLARETLENSFSPEPISSELLFPIKTPALKHPYGAFVTLNEENGNLRGCIGRITTTQPLYETVESMSKAAAFQDRRFLPLQKKELDSIVIDITILTPPHKITSYNDIVLGKHGIILTKNFHSAVFLPQVAPSLGWDLETTLQHLSRKAGLESDDWKENCTFEVFEGYEIKEIK